MMQWLFSSLLGSHGTPLGQCILISQVLGVISEMSHIVSIFVYYSENSRQTISSISDIEWTHWISFYSQEKLNW